VQAIDEAGFRANVEDRRQEDVPFWERHGRLVATSLSGGSLIVGLVLQLLLGRLSAARPFLLLAAVAGGWYVSRRAWQAMRHHQLEMNTLMTVAAVGALLIGEWAEAGSTMFLFSLAQLLEARSMDRARNAIRRLQDLSPFPWRPRRSFSFLPPWGSSPFGWASLGTWGCRSSSLETACDYLRARTATEQIMGGVTRPEKGSRGIRRSRGEYLLIGA
jgi:hypothetical protein